MGFASGVALTRGPDEDLADVDVRRQGQQPVDAIRDGLGFEQLTELGDALSEIFRRVAGNVLELTEHDAGHDQRYADALGADFAAQTFREGADSGFARRVKGAERRNVPSGDRSHDDDIPASALDQVLPDPPHQPGGPQNVELIKMVPQGFIAVQHAARKPAARIHNGDVDLAPAVAPAQRAVEELVDVGLSARIACHREGFAPLGHHVGRQIVQAALAPGMDHHGRARPGQSPCRGAAYPELAPVTIAVFPSRSLSIGPACLSWNSLSIYAAIVPTTRSRFKSHGEAGPVTRGACLRAD